MAPILQILLGENGVNVTLFSQYSKHTLFCGFRNTHRLEQTTITTIVLQMTQ